MKESQFLASIVKRIEKIRINKCKVEALEDNTFKVLSEFVIKDEYKLSDVFKRLPFGIIDKGSTGIGGTTLELKCERNSIIVEPLRAIAASKAALDPNYLYVGSACGVFQNRPTDRRIIRYLADDKIKYKKILVVADSLPKFVNLLESVVGNSTYSEYFILIDEIDSFQCDADFRDNLEKCIDIYKKFHYLKRAVISATMLEFSDPFFNAESKCLIKYENPVRRKIVLMHTSTFVLAIAERIMATLTLFPEDKILIACNSIDISLNVIQDLENEWGVVSESIKIVCSNSNFSKADKYFGEIINEKLPGQINFLTSAYFIGVDIIEAYSSIAVSTNTIPHTLLSDRKLQQIAGRCRVKDGLISETVIYNCSRNKSDCKILTQKELKEIASDFLDGMNCFDKLYTSDSLLKDDMVEIQKNLIKISDYFGYKLVRQNVFKNRDISYFNIDSFLENQRTLQNLYSNKDQLYEILSEKNDILFDEYISPRPSNKSTEPKLDAIIKEQLRLDALDDLKEVGEDLSKLKEINDNIHKAAYKERIYDIFSTLIENLRFDDAYLKTEEFSKKRDSKEFEFFTQSLIFEALDKKNSFKNSILSNFPISGTITNDLVFSKLTEIYNQHQMPLRTINTPIKALRVLKCYLTVKPRRDGSHIISGHNPQNIILRPIK